MYEFLGHNFNSLSDIFSIGCAFGFVICLLVGLWCSLEDYILERAMYWHDKRKELKHERKNR